MIGDYLSIMTGGWWRTGGLPSLTCVGTDGWWLAASDVGDTSIVSWVAFHLAAGWFHP